MRILVLGGTVYLSRTIAALARDRGHDVTAAARGRSGGPPDGVRFVRADRTATDGLNALSDETFDAVVDVARLPGHVGPALDALAERAGHWTFVSTCSVYSDHETPGQRASTAGVHDPAPADSLDEDMERYGPNKVACENLVRDRLPDRSFIVRPGLVVGPGDPNDRFGYWPLRIADGGEVLAPGQPDDLVQYIDVRDLAEWVLDAAEAAMTGTHDGICPPITRSQFLAEIVEALDGDADLTWVSQEVLQEHGVNPWAGEESLGLWLPLPEYGGFLSRDPASALAAGLRIRPLRETTLHWYANRPESPALLANLSREKEAAVLASWHARSV
ncbi:MAG TPA: NAD-dependent epimerase/dehydratase family protein [Jiangellaceae bacterium]